MGGGILQKVPAFITMIKPETAHRFLGEWIHLLGRHLFENVFVCLVSRVCSQRKELCKVDLIFKGAWCKEKQPGSHKSHFP